MYPSNLGVKFLFRGLSMLLLYLRILLLSKPKIHIQYIYELFAVIEIDFVKITLQ